MRPESHVCHVISLVCSSLLTSKEIPIMCTGAPLSMTYILFFDFYRRLLGCRVHLRGNKASEEVRVMDLLCPYTIFSFETEHSSSLKAVFLQACGFPFMLMGIPFSHARRVLLRLLKLQSHWSLWTILSAPLLFLLQRLSYRG